MEVTPSLTFLLDPKLKEAGISFDAPREGDAGFDLKAAENIVVEAGAQVIVPTGLRLSIPLGWVGIVKDRSSMASKRMYSHGGVIDASYRGEVKIVISNHGSSSFHIERGQKVAQLVVVPHLSSCAEVTSERDLGETERGTGGFGSTGK